MQGAWSDLCKVVHGPIMRQETSVSGLGPCQLGPLAAHMLIVQGHIWHICLLFDAVQLAPSTRHIFSSSAKFQTQSASKTTSALSMQSPHHWEINNGIARVFVVSERE